MSRREHEALRTAKNNSKKPNHHLPKNIYIEWNLHRARILNCICRCWWKGVTEYPKCLLLITLGSPIRVCDHGSVKEVHLIYSLKVYGALSGLRSRKKCWFFGFCHFQDSRSWKKYDHKIWRSESRVLYDASKRKKHCNINILSFLLKMSRYAFARDAYVSRF